MGESRWNDRACSQCGALAHARTLMYLQRNAPARGFEYLCTQCLEATTLPDKSHVVVTNCAEPGCVRMADGRFGLLSTAGGEIAETHYLCAEHGWTWRQSLGAEAEMTVVSVSVNARERGEGAHRLLRDDLRGAFWGEESDQVN